MVDIRHVIRLDSEYFEDFEDSEVYHELAAIEKIEGEYLVAVGSTVIIVQQYEDAVEFVEDMLEISLPIRADLHPIYCAICNSWLAREQRHNHNLIVHGFRS